MEYIFLLTSLFAGTAKGFCGKRVSTYIVTLKQGMLVNAVRMSFCMVIGILMVLVEGKGSFTSGGLWYTAAKDTKRDALINASCAHPYVADVCDQIRLHDYQGALRSSVEVMTFRKRIAEAIYGKISIDTDSGGTGSHRDFLRYMEAQPSIGVPDLYYVTSSFHTPMDEGDYAAIRTAWARYREENGL